MIKRVIYLMAPSKLTITVQTTYTNKQTLFGIGLMTGFVCKAFDVMAIRTQCICTCLKILGADVELSKLTFVAPRSFFFYNKKTSLLCVLFFTRELFLLRDTNVAKRYRLLHCVCINIASF